MSAAGLSIASQGPFQPYVLRLGATRFECSLELDHPDFAIGGGTLGAGYTLDCWLADLAQLADGDPAVLLPYDFCDQCTGLLRVTPTRDAMVEVEAGWSVIGQYSLTPANLRSPGSRVFDFDPVPDARIERPLTDVVAAVTAARAALTGS